MKMYRDKKGSSDKDFIYRIICQRLTSRFLSLHLSVWVIEWNEKDEKVLKYFIQINSASSLIDR